MFNKKLLKKYTGIALSSLIILGGVCGTSYASEPVEVTEYAIESSLVDDSTLYSFPWYGAEITLPTSSSDWWITRSRNKERKYPGTGVNRPSYSVVSNIFRGSTTTAIGTAKVHEAGIDSIGWHSVSQYEEEIRGAFRNHYTQPHNNRIDLRWSP